MKHDRLSRRDRQRLDTFDRLSDLDEQYARSMELGGFYWPAGMHGASFSPMWCELCGCMVAPGLADAHRTRCPLPAGSADQA